MGRNNAAASKYLRQVRSWLPCAGRLKRDIRERIQETVFDFLQEEPEAGYDAIVARFGTPQQIAVSYVDEMESTELLYNLRVRKKIVGLAVITAILVTAIWAGAVGMALAQALDGINGHRVTTKIDVISGETISVEVEK